jgi:hypothetical protein
VILLARLQKLLNSPGSSGLAVPILIIALGFMPAIWAPWDVILISEDLALPRTPQQFFLTLHTWNPILNTGTPYNVAHTAILTFAQQAGLQAIGLGPAVTQRLIMIVWMTLPGLGMYVLVRTLFASRLSRRRWQTAAAVAASFYMFNLYIEHAWRGFNIGVLSAQAALPLLLTLLYLGFKGRISAIRLALYTVPVALWSSGVGVNPPLVLVFVATIVAFALAYLLFSRAGRLSSRLLPVLRTVGILAAVSILTNAFWILPFVGQIQATTTGELTTSSELASNWLGGLSANASFSKVLRFQGDWTWYQGWNEPYRPYAGFYEESTGLAMLSWVAPALVIIGLAGPKRRLRLFFGVITALALLLSMGTHPPMERIYLWLVGNAPLFWIIRSPWFKFALVTSLGFAVLSGLGAANLAGWLRQVSRGSRIGRQVGSRIPAIVVIGAVASNLIYAYPVTTGQMFPAAETREHLPPNQMRIPDYIADASSWFDENVGDGRVAALPETTVWADQSGFVSFSPVLTQIGTAAIVYPFQTVHGSLVSATNGMLNDIAYEALYRASTRRADEILRLMSVRYLNHETGIKYWLYAGDVDSADWVRLRLEKQLGIEPVATFGAWEVYAVDDPLPEFYLAPGLSIVAGGVEALPTMVGMDLLSTPAILFSDQQTPEGLSRALDSPLLRDILFFASGPEEVALDLIPAGYRHPVPRSGLPVEFTIDETAEHRIWLRSPDRTRFPSGDLAVDGQPLDLSSSPGPSTPFWIPLGVHRLATGPHLLTGTLDSAAGELVVIPESLHTSLINRVQEQLLRPGLQVVYLASTENRDVNARPPVNRLIDNPVRLQFGEHLAMTETADDGIEWRWLEPDGKRALIVVNDSASTVRTNLMLTVTSLGQARDFYIFPYDGELPSNVPLIIQRLPADRATAVLVKDVEIQPGESYLMLYTAHPGTPVGDSTRNFAVRDGSLLSGRLAFDLAFESLRDGIHRLEIRPYGLDALPATVAADLDGTPLDLERQDRLGEPTFVADVPLEPGAHTLTVRQARSENYAIRVISGAVTSPPTTPGPVITTHESPTSYELEISADVSTMLVFGESFDPRWGATSISGSLEQHRVNGFANGYIMPAGQHSVRLSFGPQRLFVSGVAVSTVTLALAFLTTLGLVRRSCGSDRSEVKISSRSEKLLRPDLPPGQA